MSQNRASRSSNDGRPWKCRCGTINYPKKHRFFTLPAFKCSTCERKLALDFKFCLGEIEVAGKSLTGEVRDQKDTPFCVGYAYSKAVEVTERVFSIRNGIDPDFVMPINPHSLEQRFCEKFPDAVSHNVTSHDALTLNRGIHKMLHMGLLLRYEGCARVQGEPYKATDVSTVPRDSFEEICESLAEGTPFIGTYLAGKRRSKLQYCKIYKSPSLAAINAKKSPEIGHAVVIIGAGMKKGKKYLYFLNSWGKRFCPRKNKKGETIRAGIGKLRFEDLTKNLVKLSPPGETGGDRSLQDQSQYQINHVNYILMTVKQEHFYPKRLQRLREKTNSEFVLSDVINDGIFRDDEKGRHPQTCCGKTKARKVIKKLIHFPTKCAPLRVRFSAPKLNFTGLMEKVAEWNATVISNDESGTQPSIEQLNDVQGRVELWSVSAHAEGGQTVGQHESVKVPQAAPAKEPDAVAQISVTKQKQSILSTESERMEQQSISTESQGFAQGKQLRWCKERDVLVEDKLYREHCRSGRHMHSYTCHKNGLPPQSQEECMVEMELAGSKDLKEYDF